ncbi:MAG: hypothetical protein GX829_02590 [Clostridium sp.]|nr:hypothetical protein [Clostridium sp.]
MKRRISILLLLLAIIVALFQGIYKFEGTVGFILTTLVCSLLIFAIIYGEQVKEAIIAFAKTFL